MNKILFFLFFVLFNFKIVYAEIVGEIKIFGNERIPKETILMFLDIKKNDTIDDVKVNKVLKNL